MIYYTYSTMMKNKEGTRITFSYENIKNTKIVKWKIDESTELSKFPYFGTWKK